MKAPWHFGMRYAGQTLSWLPTDTEEITETDALNRYRLTLENPNYIDNNNFKPQDTITWTTMIEKKLNKTQTFQELWPELESMITSC